MVRPHPLHPSQLIPVILPHYFLPNAIFSPKGWLVVFNPGIKKGIAGSCIPFRVEIMTQSRSVKPQRCLCTGAYGSVTCILVPFPIFLAHGELTGKPNA
jgi:hypothetical protein